MNDDDDFDALINEVIDQTRSEVFLVEDTPGGGVHLNITTDPTSATAHEAASNARSLVLARQALDDRADQTAYAAALTAAMRRATDPLMQMLSAMPAPVERATVAGYTEYVADLIASLVFIASTLAHVPEDVNAPADPTKDAGQRLRTVFEIMERRDVTF